MKYFSALSGLCLLFSVSAVTAVDEAPVEAPLTEEARLQEPAARPQYPLNSIVAIANEDIILASELERATQQITRQLNDKGTPIPDQATLSREVLNKLVIESLQLQLATTNGITIEDSVLNEEIKGLAEKNGVSLTEFRDILERDGYSEERRQPDRVSRHPGT